MNSHKTTIAQNSKSIAYLNSNNVTIYKYSWCEKNATFAFAQCVLMTDAVLVVDLLAPAQIQQQGVFKTIIYAICKWML